MESIQLSLQPANNERLANLCGPLDAHLQLLARDLGVNIRNRGHQFEISGQTEALQPAANLLYRLYEETSQRVLSADTLRLDLQENQLKQPTEEPLSVQTKRGVIRGRTPTQRQYLEQIQGHDITFGVGPAGTGKTYLAVAAAVQALQRDEVRRLVLVRPAVEAGERLGFLPGDLAQKIDPYLRPLYDALHEMMGFDKVSKLMERHVIEVAPLAFMRGRTLNESFIILDEAQNTTSEQMKMFLTRLGFGSKAVITGDLTQVDLPRQVNSGLRQALNILDDVDGVAISRFGKPDVVRHPLVKRIVEAYEDKTEAHD